MQRSRVFAQSSRCCGSGIGLSLMGVRGVTRPFGEGGASAQGLFQNAQVLFLSVRNAFKPRYS